MKKIHRSNSQNVLYYFVAFFMIVILIILVMGGYLYRFYYKTIYTDFQQGNEQHLTAIVNHHENDMRIMDDIVTQMGVSDSVVRFRLEEQPLKAADLVEQLKRYTMVSQFFNLLLYQYHEDEYLYSYSTSMRTDSFLKSGCRIENVSPEEFRDMLMAETTKLRILPEQVCDGIWINNYLANRNKVIYLRAIPPLCQETLVFMVPDSYYDELLEGGTEDRRMDFLCYEGVLIVSRGSREASEEELLPLLAGAEDGTRQVTLGRGQYLLSLNRGESGILYGSLQSVEIFHKKFMSSQWEIIFIILLCALPASFAWMVLSEKVIRKVKSLSLLLNEEANYDLRSIEQGIETLVMDRRESEKERLALKKARFIRDFIRGGFSRREDMLEAARKAELQADYEQFLVVLIHNRELNKENKAYSSMLEMISGKKGLEGYGVHLINNNQNLFVLFSDSREKIEEVLEKILEIEQEYCEDYVIAMSDYHSSFEESPKAYLEANTALDNHLLLDNSQIIRFSEVAGREYISLLPDNYLHRLRYAIREGNKKRVEEAVKDICQKMKGENASLYTFRILYNDIIHVLLSEWKGDKGGLEDFYNVFTLSQCLNIQDFYELLCEVCNTIIDGRSGVIAQGSEIIREAVAYMQAHFADQELTMNALAEHLKVSSVTLAVEFKNEMDVRPSDYLANLRMEKAKELLRNTNMLVREISPAVGYEDGRVFMRRFKKYTGMTPGQYREEQIS